MQSKSLLTFLGALGLWTLLTSTLRDPNNPPLGNTGAPSETTCQKSGCHATVGNYTGTVSLSGLPDTVTPNQSYTITLTQTSNAVKAGFQLTCLNSSNAKCGTLTAATGVSVGSLSGRQYARQSTPKNLSGGSASWSFVWKAPATLLVDSFHFYFVSLAANGNGNNSGDVVLKSSKKFVLGATSASHEPDDAALVQLFPNPAVRFVQVKLPAGALGALSLYDAAGALVQEKLLSDNDQVDVSGLPRGRYLAKIRIGEKVVTRQLVVSY